MKTTLLVIGIILLALGVIGLLANYAVAWMWVLVILGLVGVIWGGMTKKPEVK